jgi:hypothetical protein
VFGEGRLSTTGISDDFDDGIVESESMETTATAVAATMVEISPVRSPRDLTPDVEYSESVLLDE